MAMTLWRGTTHLRLRRRTGHSEETHAPRDAARSLSSTLAFPAGWDGVSRYADA